MPRSRDDLKQALLDLLWSSWEELGVPGVVAHAHRNTWIDPEPLIVFTAVHGDLDPRLRDESIDWIVSYGELTSKARIKNLLRRAGPSSVGSFSRYAATVNEHTRMAWPTDLDERGNVSAYAFHPRAHAVLRDLAAPSLISLRIRAMFGVSARAELIRAFLSKPDAAWTPTELSEDTNYVRRQVVRALESLLSAGLARALRAGPNARYVATKTEELAAVVAPLPRSFPGWSAAFRLFSGALAALDARRSSELEASVAARRFPEEHARDLERAGIEPPDLPPGAAAARAFERWAADVAASFGRTS